MLTRASQLAGIVIACSAVLLSCCASAGAPANADQTISTSSPTVATEGSDVVLVDLDNASEVATWTTVDDPVKGGASTSGIAFDDGGLVFSGTLSRHDVPPSAVYFL